MNDNEIGKDLSAFQLCIRIFFGIIIGISLVIFDCGGNWLWLPAAFFTLIGAIAFDRYLFLP